MRTDDKEHAPVFLEYPVEAVQEIIIGEKMSEIFRKDLLDVIENTYGNIPVRIARRAKLSYDMTFEDTSKTDTVGSTDRSANDIRR